MQDGDYLIWENIVSEHGKMEVVGYRNGKESHHHEGEYQYNYISPLVLPDVLEKLAKIEGAFLLRYGRLLVVIQMLFHILISSKVE